MMSSAAFSAIIITAACILTLVITGITDASTTLKLDTPRTLIYEKCSEISVKIIRYTNLNFVSTTDVVELAESGPILHVPTG